MGKFRSKLKGQTKGKRWPKGQSSSSNPETRKYRDLAKSRFFQENLGPSNLTSDALRKHDTISSFASVPDPISTDDASSDASTYKTTQTFASDWTDCSNISFNQLLTTFTPDSALHKEMLAILAAVTEVIKQNGGEETSTEYFAALITTVEVTEFEMSLAAVLGLLGMVVRTVPRPVLRAQFAPASRLFIELLERFSQQDNALIIKELLGLLAQLLKVQELAVWQDTNTLQMLGTLLAFTCHTKPKVRRAAQRGVVSVLEEQPPAQHPAASHVANFCIAQLEAGGGTLHALALLGAVGPRLPAAPLRRSVERVLALLGGDALLATCALRVLHAVCSAEHSVALPPAYTARLAAALLELQPGSAPEAWLSTLTACVVLLARQDAAAVNKILPQAFTAVTALWLSARPPVLVAATHAATTLLESCGPIPDGIYTTLLACLGYQFHVVWHLVLHVLAMALRLAPHPALLGPVLQHLAELRDSYQFSYNNELEAAVGAAVKANGPEVVLEAVPLRKPDGSVNMERSWMLPVLKENVQGSSLEYFSKEILPLGLQCERQAALLQQHNDSIGAHSLSLLGTQCWGLLPSFCRRPTDVPQNFRLIAKTLGSAITDRKDLRLFVMSALRKLMQTEENHLELGRFAKNYLPILFNVYTTKPVGTDEEGQRLAALDTVKEYLQIAPEDLRKQLYDNAMYSWKESKDQDPFTRESLLDLIRCLSIHQPSTTLTTLFAECLHPMLGASSPKKEQKKAYRILEELCVHCEAFVKSHRKQISTVLSRGLGAAPCSRAARLRVQGALLKATPQLGPDSRFLRSVVPEAVMCTVEPSAKARQGAKALLLVAAEKLEARGELPQLVGLLLAGLSGPPELVRATVTALAIVTEAHASALGQETSRVLVDAMVKMSISDVREIVSACLLYFKVYISVVPTPIAAQNLPDIMKALTSMTSDCSNHFRLRVRDILDKLLRKFGSEAICSHVPPSDLTMLKRLKNLRKMQDRKKRRKHLEDHEDDAQQEEFGVRATSSTMQDILADSDEEEEKESKTTKQKTWIQEDAEDIIDFTNPTFAGRITSKRPGAKPNLENTQKAERGFKTSSDGRLIIQDLGGDSSDSSESDVASEAETVKMGPVGPAKRKRTDTESVVSTAPAKMKYKAGGSGIHRNLDPYAYLPLQRKMLNKRKRPQGGAPFKKLLNNKRNK